MAVLVTNDFPPHHGGIQRFMSRLAQEWSARASAVLVVAPVLPDCAQFDRQQAYRVLRYANPSRVIGFAAMTVALLRARLSDRGTVTLASMWFPGGLAACLIPKPLRGRLGVLAHGTEIAPGRGGLRRMLMRYVFARADVIVANSSFTRKLLQDAGIRSAIAVVNPGVDGGPITPERAAVPTIISVGRLVARKGFDRVIASLPALKNAFPDVRYEIVGSGPQRAELERLAGELGVSEHVVFLGAVDDDDMKRAYARAWVFALPVRAIAGDVEGFGVVYLEAALADLPTVGGYGSGAEDAIASGESGYLVDGNSQKAISDVLESLLTDRALAARMGQSGRERALRSFTWGNTAAQILALLETRAAGKAEATAKA